MIKQIKVDLEIACPDWQKTLIGDQFSDDLDRFLSDHAYFLKPVDTGLRAWHHSEIIRISLVLTDDNMSQVLNATYRGKDQPTNVLSFAQLEELEVYPDEALIDITIGDIVIAYQTIVCEAHQQSKPVMVHLKHMIVHGILHLLGYDHIKDEDAVYMEKMECALLEKWQVPNPYDLGET